MKTFRNIFLAVVALVALTACDTKTNPGTKTKGENGREESMLILHTNYGVHVMSYKGHEYLVNFHGGILHSESCPCQKNKVIVIYDTIQAPKINFKEINNGK